MTLFPVETPFPRGKVVVCQYDLDFNLTYVNSGLCRNGRVYAEVQSPFRSLDRFAVADRPIRSKGRVAPLHRRPGCRGGRGLP